MQSWLENCQNSGIITFNFWHSVEARGFLVKPVRVSIAVKKYNIHSNRSQPIILGLILLIILDCEVKRSYYKQSRMD